MAFLWKDLAYKMEEAILRESKKFLKSNTSAYFFPSSVTKKKVLRHWYQIGGSAPNFKIKILWAEKHKKQREEEITSEVLSYSSYMIMI